MWDTISRDAAVSKLGGQGDGTFLVRPGSKPNSWSISVVQDGQVRHIRIIGKNGGFCINNKDEPLPSLSGLINNKMGAKLSSKLEGTAGQAQASQLLSHIMENPEKQVFHQQADNYIETESTGMPWLDGEPDSDGGDDDDGPGVDPIAARALEAANDPTVRKGVKVEAIGKYVAQQEGELSFEIGDRIFVVLADPKILMWQGVLNGKAGKFPRAMVAPFDQEERKQEMETKKAELEASGKKVAITRCVVQKAFTAEGPGELSLTMGAAVMLPTKDVTSIRGIDMYKGVSAGQVGTFPVECVTESTAAAVAPQVAQAPAPDPAPAPVAPVAPAVVEAPAPAGGAGPNPTTVAMVEKLYTFMPPDGDGCVGGAQLQAVMKKSQPPLSNQMMGGIWALSDTNKAGKLNKDQLVTLLGLMSIAQTGATPSTNALTSATPPPTIDGLVVAAVAAVAPAATPPPAAVATPAGPGPFEENAPINAMAAKLFGMFKQAPASGALQAGQLKPVMEQSKPPMAPQVLGGVWQLCDEGKKGSLTFAEVKRMFGLMAMAQAGTTPAVAALNSLTPPPTITGLS